MIIQKFFETIMTNFENYIEPLNTLLLIVAISLIIIGIYYLVKKKSKGKYICLIGLLLIINPIIHFLPF